MLPNFCSSSVIILVLKIPKISYWRCVICSTYLITSMLKEPTLPFLPVASTL
jgi:hypothetical protein